MGDGKTDDVEEGAIGDESSGDLVSVHRRRGGVAGDSDDKDGMRKMRGRDKIRDWKAVG